LYRRHVERAGKFTIRFRTADGTEGEHELFALSKDEMRQSYRPKGYALQPWRLEEFPPIGTAWLTMNTMEPGDLDAARIVPEKFLSSVLNALNKGKASTLVIDVRGANGHDLGIAEQVFSIIGLQP